MSSPQLRASIAQLLQAAEKTEHAGFLLDRDVKETARNSGLIIAGPVLKDLEQAHQILTQVFAAHGGQLGENAIAGLNRTIATAKRSQSVIVSAMGIINDTARSAAAVEMDIRAIVNRLSQ